MRQSLQNKRNIKSDRRYTHPLSLRISLHNNRSAAGMYLLRNNIYLPVGTPLPDPKCVWHNTGKSPAYSGRTVHPAHPLYKIYHIILYFCLENKDEFDTQIRHQKYPCPIELIVLCLNACFKMMRQGFCSSRF